MKELTEKQLQLMNIIWGAGNASTAEIHSQLDEDDGWARTTVATMLARLEKYGFLRHSQEGNSFRYYPLVKKQDVKKSAVSNMISNLFAGESTALVNYLVDENQIDENDLETLRNLLKKRSDKS